MFAALSCRNEVFLMLSMIDAMIVGILDVMFIKTQPEFEYQELQELVLNRPCSKGTWHSLPPSD